MALNNFFPASYQPMYPQGYNPYQQNQQQIQNSGLVIVRSRAEAQNYPVAPGNSVTFKDETAPYVYTKTMGFSQLDRPVFETFRLIREDEAAEPTRNDANGKGEEIPAYALKSDLEAVTRDLEALKAQVNKKPERKKGEKDE